MSYFVGLDVSMEETAYCARNAEGRILGQGKTVTDPDAIAAALARFGRPCSGWVNPGSPALGVLSLRG